MTTKEKYQKLTPGMIIKPTDEILHRGKWYPASEYSFTGPRWTKDVKPMRREIIEKDKN